MDPEPRPFPVTEIRAWTETPQAGGRAWGGALKVSKQHGQISRLQKFSLKTKQNSS